jgi:HAD superfamily hydrolase (TIGR01509 family)
MRSLYPNRTRADTRDAAEVLASEWTTEYGQMLDNPEVIRRVAAGGVLAVLEWAREQGYRTAVATASHRAAAMRALDALGIRASFDVIVTWEDVERRKPDPEVYEKAARDLGVEPRHCLAIEDSPPGVKAALAAGVAVVAVATPFTHEALTRLALLDPRWIVHDPAKMLQTVQERMTHSASYNDQVA